MKYFFSDIVDLGQMCPTLVTQWTVAHQAPLSFGFSRQEHWSRLPCPPAGDLSNPETDLHCGRFFIF